MNKALKEVTWPPKVHRRRGGPSPIPDLNSKMNLGTNRKQKMNLELEAFHSAATLQLSSNPFASGKHMHALYIKLTSIV